MTSAAEAFEHFTRFDPVVTAFGATKALCHFGCVFFGCPFPRDAECVGCVGLEEGTQETHPVELIGIHLKCTVPCMGGVHGLFHPRTEISRAINFSDCSLNGRPINGSFNGICRAGDRQFIMRKMDYPQQRKIIPCVPRTLAAQSHFNKIVIEWYIDWLYQGADDEVPIVTLLLVCALRATCSAMRWHPRLVRLATELVVRLQQPLYCFTGDAFRPVTPDARIRHVRFWRRLMDCDVTIVSDNTVMRDARVSFVPCFEELVPLIIDAARHKKALRFGVMIPIKPTSLYKHVYLFGAWLIGKSSKQFKPRGWMQQKIFTFLEDIALCFERCGHGYDGENYYYHSLFKAAFALTQSESDTFTGMDRVVYRLEKLNAALQLHRGPNRIAFTV